MAYVFARYTCKFNFVSVSGADENSQGLRNHHGLSFAISGNNRVYIDNWNDGAYHIYRIEHRFYNDYSHFRFFIDGQFYDSLISRETTSAPWYISLQGRSYRYDNAVDWVKVFGIETY